MSFLRTAQCLSQQGKVHYGIEDAKGSKSRNVCGCPKMVDFCLTYVNIS